MMKRYDLNELSIECPKCCHWIDIRFKNLNGLKRQWSKYEKDNSCPKCGYNGDRPYTLLGINIKQTK